MKPLLAATIKNIDELKFPLLASAKLDGVRALIVDGVVMSRSLKPIPNKHVQKLFGHKKYNGLDGELIVGHSAAKDVYTKTTSGVMSIEGEPDVRLFVFDKYDEPGGFSDRASAAINIKMTTQSMEWVPHTTIPTQHALADYELTAITAGYEGVMLRHPDGLYKHGRSTLKEAILMKLKRFDDSEAWITGFTEEMQNTNEKKLNELGQQARSHKKAGMVGKGRLGNFTVQDVKSGVEFEIGSGFTQADREKFWATREDLIGEVIKYKFFPVGVKDKPRHPVYLGFRNKIDL